MKTLGHRPYTGKYIDSVDFDRGIITRLSGKIATKFTQMLFVNQSPGRDLYLFTLFVEYMTKDPHRSEVPNLLHDQFFMITPIRHLVPFKRFLKRFITNKWPVTVSLLTLTYFIFTA